MCAQSGAAVRGGPRDPRPIKAETRPKAGPAIRRTGKLMMLQSRASPTAPNFARASFLPQGFCALAAALPGGLRCNPEAQCLPLSPLPLMSTAR
jgi:hypothetical protein